MALARKAPMKGKPHLMGTPGAMTETLVHSKISKTAPIIDRPTRVVESTPGAKHDAGKHRFHLLPLQPLRQIVEVLGYGADLYEEDNWQKVPDARKRYYDALLRHVTSWYEGERTDKDSGKSHLAHAGCCILFLLHFDR